MNWQTELGRTRIVKQEAPKWLKTKTSSHICWIGTYELRIQPNTSSQNFPLLLKLFDSSSGIERCLYSAGAKRVNEAKRLLLEEVNYYKNRR